MEDVTSERRRPQNSAYSEELYNNTGCAVVIGGQPTDWYEEYVGLRQGVLPPTLFNIFLEFVMKELKDLDKTYILTDSLSLSTYIGYANNTN